MLLLAALLSLSVHAYDATNVEVTGHQLPTELVNVGVEEHLGQQLDLALKFTTDQGEVVPLGQLLHKNRPVVMAMVYYNCPSLCSYHLNGVTEALKKLRWTSGQQFDVIAVSMASTETAELARAKKQSYLNAYGRDSFGTGWHFLTGSKENIQALADQLGFRFKWLPEKKEFAHAAVAYVITPEGKISRYLHGVQPEVGTIKLSLIEASNGRIGSYIEQAFMFCFRFDPKKNKYTLYAWNLMRAGALVMVLLLAIFLAPMWWREQRR
jgi:protein SCO1/2